MTRKPIIVLFLIAAALLGETQTGNAQSPYSHPWCSISSGDAGGGARSCYYETLQQCMATLSGIGGNCVESPYYRAQPTQLPDYSVVKPRHRRHPRTAK